MIHDKQLPVDVNAINRALRPFGEFVDDAEINPRITPRLNDLALSFVQFMSHELPTAGATPDGNEEVEAINRSLAVHDEAI